MPKKLTYDFVRNEIKKRNGTLLSKKYINSYTPLEVSCNKCGYVWKPIIQNIIHKNSWCPKCSLGKYSEKDILGIIKNRNGTLLSLSSTTVKGRIKILCNKCNYIWKTRLDCILKGSWCPKCAGKTKYSFCEVKEKIESLSGHLLSKKYINGTTPLKVSCNKCNYIWKPTFRGILKGSWCPKCSGKLKHTIGTAKKILKQSNISLISTEYKNIQSYLDVQCDLCNNLWKVTLNSAQQKHGCPNCKNKSQAKLVSILKKIFPNDIIKVNSSFPWLKTKNGKQHIDIYIPRLKLAIEYDGRQHFIPVCFGGISIKKAKEKLKYQKKMDRIKNNKIKNHKNCIEIFIRIPYKQNLTKNNIIKILKTNEVSIE